MIYDFYGIQKKIEIFAPHSHSHHSLNLNLNLNQITFYVFLFNFRILYVHKHMVWGRKNRPASSMLAFGPWRRLGSAAVSPGGASRRLGEASEAPRCRLEVPR